MRRLLALVSGFTALACVAAQAQGERLATEGRGVVRAPSEMPTTFGGPPPEHPFVSDRSGTFSRTIFETDEDPNFRLVIRDFSFPPDRRTRTVTLPFAAFVHFLGEPGETTIAGHRAAVTSTARMAVPAGTPIEVMNPGEQPVVMRVLIVEAK